MHNHYLELLVLNGKVGEEMTPEKIVNALQSINIESISDHHTKIIARTIMSSIEAFKDYLLETNTPS